MSKLIALLLLVSLTIITSCHDEHDGHGHNHEHDHDHEHNHQHDHEHHHNDPEGKYPTDSHVLILTDETLHQAIDDFSLILVKFFAPWCGHCKTLAPTYKELAIDLAHSGHHEFAIAEIDCTINKSACSSNGIRGYPTLKYFIDGEAHQYNGRRGKEEIAEWLIKKRDEVRKTGNQEL